MPEGTEGGFGPFRYPQQQRPQFGGIAVRRLLDRRLAGAVALVVLTAMLVSLQASDAVALSVGSLSESVVAESSGTRELQPAAAASLGTGQGHSILDSQLTEALERATVLEDSDNLAARGSISLQALPAEPLGDFEGVWYIFGDYVRVDGVIRNSAGRAYNYVEVTCQLLSRAGVVLDETRTYAHTYRLAPGEYASFKSSFYRPNASQEDLTVRAHVTGVPELSPTPIVMTPVSEHVALSVGARVFTVVFRNDSPYTVEKPMVGGWERTSNGELVDTLFTADFDVRIKPGETWTAEFVGFNLYAPVHSHYYYCQAARVRDDSRPDISIAGSNRIATAIQASQAAFRSADTVVIATGYNWPDALGGTSLAGVLKAPILLVEPNALPGAAATEIRRLGAKRAIILGGPAAVGPAVQGRLVSLLGANNVERIAGNDRYQTANQVALRVVAEQGADYDGTAFVATGGGFPDALAAAPIAAAQGWPLFLADPARGLTPATRGAMSKVEHVYILGGTAVVSGPTEAAIKGLGKTTRRLAGSDRYSTAVAVAAHAVTHLWHTWHSVGISTGADFPDALAGGVLQGEMGSVMLLTAPNELNPHAARALRANWTAIDAVTFFGGGVAVSQDVRSQALRAAGVSP